MIEFISMKGFPSLQRHFINELQLESSTHLVQKEFLHMYACLWFMTRWFGWILNTPPQAAQGILLFYICMIASGLCCTKSAHSLPPVNDSNKRGEYRNPCPTCNIRQSLHISHRFCAIDQPKLSEPQVKIPSQGLPLYHNNTSDRSSRGEVHNLISSSRK